MLMLDAYYAYRGMTFHKNTVLHESYGPNS